MKIPVLMTNEATPNKTIIPTAFVIELKIKLSTDQNALVYR